MFLLCGALLYVIFSDVVRFVGNLKGQCHVTVNKHVISRIYIVGHTWPLYSVQILVDWVNPH